MAVNLTFLQASKFQDTVTQPESYLYKDLYLDLQVSYATGAASLRDHTVIDLRALTDIDAIETSIVNILLTSPGQKILDPTFGIDLRRYLFYPINARIGYLIGLEFTNRLPKFEPRIQVDNVNVGLLPEENSYNVNVSFSVPSIPDSNKFTIKGKLNSNGYTII